VPSRGKKESTVGSTGSGFDGSINDTAKENGHGRWFVKAGAKNTKKISQGARRSSSNWGEEKTLKEVRMDDGGKKFGSRIEGNQLTLGTWILKENGRDRTQQTKGYYIETKRGLRRGLRAKK